MTSYISTERKLITLAVGVFVAMLLLAVAAIPARSEGRNLTYELQVATDSDAKLAAIYAEYVRQRDNLALRTFTYFQCLTDDGYGRKRPCATDYP